MKKQYIFTTLLILLLGLDVSAQVKGWDTCQNIGLGTSSFARLDDIYFFNKDTGFVGTSYGQILKTTTGGHYWSTIIIAPQGSYFRSMEFSGNCQYGIAGALNGHVYRTQDRGNNWTDISFNVPDTGTDLRRICGLSHWGNNFFYGVGWWGGTIARFYKSTDAGQNWTVSYIDTNLATGLVDIIALSADTIFVSGGRQYQNGTKRESAVLRSVDGGQSWTKIFSDTTLGGRIWKLQAVDHRYIVGSIEPGYGGDTVAMIKSTDAGDHWQIIRAAQMSSLSWGTQGIGFMNRAKGWLGGYYDGLFETSDSGTTWTYVFNKASWANRFFKADDTTMYLSGASVYKYSDSAHKPGVGIPQPPKFKHTLYPVSPNPASGMVTISFDLKETTNTLVEVVNIDGRKIYPVANGYLSPGHYSYTWNGTGEPAGNYIIWLGTDETPMVQKFTLR